jgi:long-chain acyl-CoA synthetase
MTAEPSDVCGSLRLHAEKRPHQAALYCGDVALTWSALEESSANLARWFLDQGLRPGDRVALHWSNSIEVVQLFFALFKAGLIVVTINTRLKPAEIRYILDHSDARMCFSEPALAPLAEQAGAACSVIDHLPSLERANEYSTAMPEVSCDQPALIIYTSGTTARPKGAVHSHRSLFHVARNAASLTRHLESVTRLCALPVMHMAALTNVIGSVYQGTPMVMLPKFDPAAVLDAVERYSCSAMTCLPALTLFVVEEQARKPRNISSLRLVTAGGDAVSLALQNRFKALFGIPLVEGYAMTETIPIACNRVDDPRMGSMGLPIEGVDMRVVDSDGQDVADGEPGEIVVRSPATCVGYWNDPVSTNETMGSGWFHTGDLASRDADGYYWFKGRKKEIIIRAGSNISPQEVEEALYKHPAVLEVGVVGIPDPIYGERVVASIVLREGQTVDAQELRQFAQKLLADYKVPEDILFLKELPKSPVGKVHRRTLKEKLLAYTEMAKKDGDGSRDEPHSALQVNQLL